MEDSTRERAVKDLVVQARRVLPKQFSNTTEIECAIHLLANAIERLVDSSVIQMPLVAFKSEETSDEYGPEQLEKLYDSIMDRTGQTPTSEQRKFLISFPDVELSVDEVWPDGDAPEDPTPGDVIEQMRGYGGVTRVISAWQLIESLAVGYRGNENGYMEVEWDGS